MSDRPEILIAKDIVTKIAEGDVSIVNNLQSRIEEYDDIVLFSSVLSEGIEKAENATVEGMHAIARLICLSRIDNVLKDDSSKEANSEGLAIAFLKYDFLLTYMISPNADHFLLALVNGQLPLRGFRTNDVHFATALLCLRDIDMINTRALGRLLKVLHIDRTNDDDRDCDAWYLPEEFIEKTRTKVLEDSQGE